MDVGEFRSGNLPHLLTSFIGRESEKTEVKQLFLSTRLLTITGPGGSGKTRLALEIAHELLSGFEDGVWLVELAPVSDPSLVLPTVAFSLGLQEQQGQTLAKILIDYCRPQELLLVLDNCEHLIEACATMAEKLLNLCPRLKILATSREALKIPGELTYPLKPLPVPESGSDWTDWIQNEAVRLFAERARNTLPAFTLSESNVESVSQICRRLDGIPLAIELAAARVNLLSVEQIASRLDDRFNLLASGRRTALPHQQTLRTEMDWSYQLLSPPEQAFFRRLSVFSGSWSLEAAEAICMEAGGCFDLMGSLVDKSLVFVDQHGKEPRYRMLETIREYACERLAEQSETDETKDRHFQYYLKLAVKAEPELIRSNQVYWLNLLETEHDNLRAALSWGLENLPPATVREPLEVMQMVKSLAEFWYIHVHWSEGRNWMKEALKRDQAAPAVLKAWVLASAGYFAEFQTDFQEAHKFLNQSLTIFQELGDFHGQGRALFWKGMLVGDQGDNDRSLAFLEESLVMERAAHHKDGIAYTLHLMGEFLRDVGQVDKAHQFLKESLDLFRELGDVWAIALSLETMAMTESILGSIQTALEMAEESISLWKELGDFRQTGVALYVLAKIQIRQGNYQTARQNLIQSATLVSRQADWISFCQSLESLANIGCELNAWDRAAQLYAAASAIRETFQAPIYLADQPDFERNMELIRQNLDPETFRTDWETGRAMDPHQAIAFARLASNEPQLGKNPSPAPTPLRAAKEQYDGLTAREREVAALIAQGKSNAAIASALYVGVRTVEAHITRILMKLGYTSRTQIAGWAVQKGLGQPEKEESTERTG